MYIIVNYIIGIFIFIVSFRKCFQGFIVLSCSDGDYQLCNSQLQTTEILIMIITVAINDNNII